MKTIEERANEIFENYPNPYEMPDDTCAYFDGEQVCDMMVKIATDQKKIDADSMHAIMEENVIKAIEKQRQIDIDKAIMWMESYFPEELDGYQFEFVKREEIINDFRKAMEE